MALHELILLAMILFPFCSPASFSPFAKNLIPENTYENMGVNRIQENHTTFDNIGSTVNKSEYTTILRKGGVGGHGGNGNGKGGQSNTSPQGGGNGMVPVYVAGAAGYHRNLNGAATTYTQCWNGWFSGLIAATTLYLLLDIPVM